MPKRRSGIQNTSYRVFRKVSPREKSVFGSGPSDSRSQEALTHLPGHHLGASRYVRVLCHWALDVFREHPLNRWEHVGLGCDRAARPGLAAVKQPS